QGVAPSLLHGVSLGVTVCEDIWNDPDFWPVRLYPDDPVARLCAQGAELILNLSASPFTLEKRILRPRMLSATAKKYGRTLIFVNQVGGQDDLLFDGRSLVIDPAGRTVVAGRELAEDLLLCDVTPTRVEGDREALRPALATDEDAALEALILGTRDYARRCGFSSAVLGVSGGIDSALV